MHLFVGLPNRHKTPEEEEERKKEVKVKLKLNPRLCALRNKEATCQFIHLLFRVFIQRTPHLLDDFVF